MLLRILKSLREIPREAWNRLAPANFPFARHEFLHALETSACVGPGTGWTPRYFTLWEGERLCAASYLYEKTDSFGEFIFDWEWAQAYRRVGLPYYPKLMGAVPFTPATGAKLLTDGENAGAHKQALLAAIFEWAEADRASGLHFLFLPKSELPFFEPAGFAIRHSFQYHWENQAYPSFEAFLDRLKRKRRQAIASERRQVAESGIEILRLSGAELTEEHATVLYAFVQSTFLKKNGSLPYLNEAFFQEIFRSMPEKILLVLARHRGEWVAGAINFLEGDTLFGRYWGCSEDWRFLHFEICYYQAIEAAITLGLKRFEAGAGGRHKVQRGFLPTLTYSAHWLRHPAFAEAIGRFIVEEKSWLDLEFKAFERHLPYK